MEIAFLSYVEMLSYFFAKWYTKLVKLAVFFSYQQHPQYPFLCASIRLKALFVCLLAMVSSMPCCRSLQISTNRRCWHSSQTLFVTALAKSCSHWVGLSLLKRSAIPHEKCSLDAHLPFLGREPVYVDKPLKSVTHGQCDAGPTVTSPAAGHHRRLTGTKLYS